MAITKKKTATKKKASPSAKKICRKVIKQDGINQATGRLKKGYKYVNGKPKKVTAKK